MRETEILRGLHKAKRNKFADGMVPGEDPNAFIRRRNAENAAKGVLATKDQADAALRSNLPPSAPAPQQPAPPVQPSGMFGGLKKLIDNRMSDASKYRHGTPFVHGQGGVDKVPAMLTRGEAVLPVKTVQALGPHNIAQTIAQTTGRAPKVGLRQQLPVHASVGTVLDDGVQWAKNAAGNVANRVRGLGSGQPQSGAPAPEPAAAPNPNFGETAPPNPQSAGVTDDFGNQVREPTPQPGAFKPPEQPSVLRRVLRAGTSLAAPLAKDALRATPFALMELGTRASQDPNVAKTFHDPNASLVDKAESLADPALRTLGDVGGGMAGWQLAGKAFDAIPGKLGFWGNVGRYSLQAGAGALGTIAGNSAADAVLPNRNEQPPTAGVPGSAGAGQPVDVRSQVAAQMKRGWASRPGGDQAVPGQYGPGPSGAPPVASAGPVAPSAFDQAGALAKQTLRGVNQLPGVADAPDMTQRGNAVLRGLRSQDINSINQRNALDGSNVHAARDANGHMSFSGSGDSGKFWDTPTDADRNAQLARTQGDIAHLRDSAMAAARSGNADKALQLAPPGAREDVTKMLQGGGLRAGMSAHASAQLDQQAEQNRASNELIRDEHGVQREGMRNTRAYQIATEQRKQANDDRTFNAGRTDAGAKATEDFLKTSPYSQKPNPTTGKSEFDPDGYFDLSTRVATAAQDKTGRSIQQLMAEKPNIAQQLIHTVGIQKTMADRANAFGQGLFGTKGPGTAAPKITDFRDMELGKDFTAGGVNVPEAIGQVGRETLAGTGRGVELDTGNGQKQWVPISELMKDPHWNDMRAEITRQLSHGNPHKAQDFMKMYGGA